MPDTTFRLRGVPLLFKAYDNADGTFSIGVAGITGGGGGGTGDASEATLATRLAEATFTDRVGATNASPYNGSGTATVISALLGLYGRFSGANLLGSTRLRNAADSAFIDPLSETIFTGRLGEVQTTPTANTVLGRLKDLTTEIVLKAGSNRIGKITLRNAADNADIDPLSESIFTARLGEVQTTPTANTVLGRLKDLTTEIVLKAGSNRVGKFTMRNAADSADIDPLSETVFTGRFGSLTDAAWDGSAASATLMSVNKYIGTRLGQFFQASTPGYVRLGDGTLQVDLIDVGGYVSVPVIAPDLTVDTATVALGASPDGGASCHSFMQNTAAAYAANVKNQPGKVTCLSFFNLSTSPRFVRLYNQTSSPAAADNANILWRGIVPGCNTTGQGAGFVFPIVGGEDFGTGIGIRVTAAIADTDNTSLNTDGFIGNVHYA
jgi:hypothetical protein